MGLNLPQKPTPCLKSPFSKSNLCLKTRSRTLKIPKAEPMIGIQTQEPNPALYCNPHFRQKVSSETVPLGFAAVAQQAGVTFVTFCCLLLLQRLDFGPQNARVWAKRRTRRFPRPYAALRRAVVGVVTVAPVRVRCVVSSLQVSGINAVKTQRRRRENKGLAPTFIVSSKFCT